MAKAKVKNLDEAINSIFKRYNSNLRKAMEYAAKKAEDEIDFEARSCLDRYYESYDPNWYDRDYHLIDAFVKVNEVTTDKNNIVARVGVIYDPSKLEGAYYSEASRKPEFNPVNSEWVLQNYLAGIHPSTNGYPIYNKEDGRAIYMPIEIEGVPSPDSTMRSYIENYKDTFDKNVLKWFAKRVIGR
jgi:hypothetical protein